MWLIPAGTITGHINVLMARSHHSRDRLSSYNALAVCISDKDNSVFAKALDEIEVFDNLYSMSELLLQTTSSLSALCSVESLD